MPKKNKTIPRSFYYYDIILMKNESTGLVELEDQGERFYEIFKYIKDKQDEIGRGEAKLDEIAISINSGDKMYVLVDKIAKKEPIEFKMVLCKTDAFPLVENNGTLSFLTDYISDGSGLAEITHCVIFPDHNIMGAEYNFSGAKTSALKTYIQRLFHWVDHVYCANKLNDRIVDKLRKGKKLSLFSISVFNNSRALTELMNSSNSIFSPSFAGISNVDTYEITLKKKRGKSKDGFDSPIPIEEMDEFLYQYREDIARFEVSQGSMGRDSVNLLQDKLVKRHGMTKTQNKTIDSTEAYTVIKEFFNETVKPTLYK